MNSWGNAYYILDFNMPSQPFLKYLMSIVLQMILTCVDVTPIMRERERERERERDCML